MQSDFCSFRQLLRGVYVYVCVLKRTPKKGEGMTELEKENLEGTSRTQHQLLVVVHSNISCRNTSVYFSTFIYFKKFLIKL